jgi:hypothetical protein
VTITDDAVIFKKVGGIDVLDIIPLVEITEVSQSRPTDNDFIVPNPSSKVPFT